MRSFIASADTPVWVRSSQSPVCSGLWLSYYTQDLNIILCVCLESLFFVIHTHLTVRGQKIQLHKGQHL